MLQAGSKQSRPRAVTLRQERRRHQSQGPGRNELDAYFDGCDKHSECCDPKGKRRAQESCYRGSADACKIQPEPELRAPLVDEVLHARCRTPAEQFAVAFEPSQEGDNFVEFCKAEPSKPAEGK